MPDEKWPTLVHTLMTAVAILLLLIAALLELTLGARLLLLARVSGGAAETSLGVAFFVDAFAQVAGAVTGRLSGSLWVLGFSASTLLTVIATGALLFGVVRVFEQHRPELLKVAAGIALAVLCGHALIFLLGAGELEVRFIRARWLNRCFSAFAFLWAAIASFRAYRASVRQMKIGLSSRLEATRFLLWAVAAVSFLIVIVLLFLRDVAGLPRAVTVIAHPLLAVACVSAVWLTFFPPGWLARRLVVANAPR